MDRLSALLGHSSIKVTEKHYARWVRARQEQLEADVRRTWVASEPEHLTTWDLCVPCCRSVHVVVASLLVRAQGTSAAKLLYSPGRSSQQA